MEEPPPDNPPAHFDNFGTGVPAALEAEEVRRSATAPGSAEEEASWRAHLAVGATRTSSLAVGVRRKSGRIDGAGPAVESPLSTQRRGSHPQNYAGFTAYPANPTSKLGKQCRPSSTHDHFTCYSVNCRKAIESDGWKGAQLRPCYSSACSFHGSRPKRSYWRHPKVKALLIRAKICCIQNLPARIQPYSSFVPRILHDYLQRLSVAEERGEGEYLPHGEVHKGAVLLADASGFTVLTERLSAKVNGAEILCGVLNEFFDEMVRIIHEHGGDVVKFAGDAVMVLWESDRVDRRSNQTMQSAALCATQCALAIHNRLHNFKALDDDEGAVHLTLHIGIGCGQLTSIHVGGVFNRWEFVVGGPPMHSQCAIAEPSAEPGETVVSAEVWNLIKDVADGTRLAALTGEGRTIDPKAHDFVLVHRLNCSAEVPSGHDLKIEPRAADLEYLQRYIPSAVHKRLEAGHDAYIAEIRPISIVFIKVDGVSIEAHQTRDDAVPLDCTEAIVFGQELMLKIQEIIYEFEGSLNKMMIDDKGQVILCAFGLNPYFHHDDPIRAVRSAMIIVKRLKNLRKNVSVSVGVASGRSFCGIIGSNRKAASATYGQRREYTVMGAMVNLAARLMGSAAQNGVLVDNETRNRTKNLPDIQYDSHEMKLKGLGLQTVWEPRDEARPKNRSSLRETLSKSAELAVNARKKELTKIAKALKNEELTGVVVVITGGRGAGKGAVYDAAMDTAKELGYVVLASNVKKSDAKSKSRDAGDSALDTVQEGDTRKDYKKPTFSVWRSIFAEMVATGAESEDLSKAQYLRRILETENGGAPHIALLKLVLPNLDIPTPTRPTTANSPRPVAAPTLSKMSDLGRISKISYWDLTVEHRQILMIDMMTRCLEYFTRRNKTLVAMHLQTGTSYNQIMDSESWMLSQNIADRLCTKRRDGVQKLVLFMTNRPSVYYSPPEYDHIQEVAARTGTCIHLKPLDRSQRDVYLAEYLNVDPTKVPKVLKDYISAMGGGNPKNTEEILDKIRDEDHAFHVEDDAVILSPDFESLTDFNGLKLPPKLISTQLNVLERMQEKHRLVIKIASVWETFTLAMLKDILPYHRERDELAHILLNLVESSILSVGLIPEELKAYHPEAGITTAYSFVSKVMQQQANALLLEQQRQEIQPSIDQLEKRRSANRVHANEIAQYASLLKSARTKMIQWLGINPEFEVKMTGSTDQQRVQSDRFNADGDTTSLRRRPGFRAGRLTVDGQMGKHPTATLPARTMSDEPVSPSAGAGSVFKRPPRLHSADPLTVTQYPSRSLSNDTVPATPDSNSVMVLSARVRELEQQLHDSRAQVAALHQKMSLKDDLIAQLTAQLAQPLSAPQDQDTIGTDITGGRGGRSPRSPWLGRKKKADKGIK